MLYDLVAVVLDMACRAKHEEHDLCMLFMLMDESAHTLSK